MNSAFQTELRRTEVSSVLNFDEVGGWIAAAAAGFLVAAESENESTLCRDFFELVKVSRGCRNEYEVLHYGSLHSRRVAPARKVK